MEIIEQIGSYAGLAAIVGLAVLSALYFSQARDLRRLRESRDEEVAGALPAHVSQAQRHQAQRPAAAAGAVAATPAGGKQADRGAGRVDAPPQVRPAPVAGQGNAQGPATPAPARAGATSAPAQAGISRAAAKAADPAAPAQGGATSAPAQAPPRPAPPRSPAQGRPAISPRRAPLGAPLPAAARPWYRRLALRHLLLILAGVVVLGAAGVGIATLSGEEDVADSGSGGAERQAQPLDPSTVSVSVLNGTSVPGLAAQIADSVESAGFQRGNVANATETASAESAVLFAEGARQAARQVGRELDVSQVEPLDPESEALAGNADVVVIVGADQTQ
jgi:hypothetical protein